MGLIPAETTVLSEVAKLSVSRFARRRLAVVMARTGMVENVQTAVRFVEQGHVRVGTDVSFTVFFSLLFLLLFIIVLLPFNRLLHLDLLFSSPFLS